VLRDDDQWVGGTDGITDNDIFESAAENHKFCTLYDTENPQDKKVLTHLSVIVAAR
jgi:hypothetical protein